MTIGVRIGLDLSVGVGPAIGQGDSGITWTVDDDSGISTPADASEWADVMDAAGISSGGPSHLWLAQEASGGLEDSIGSATLAAGGSSSYQQTVAGWARRSIRMADGGGTNFTGNGAGDTTAMSVLLLGYVRATGVAGSGRRDVFGVGSSNGHRYAEIGTTGSNNIYGVDDPIAATRAQGAADPGTSVARPVVLRVDRTNNVTAVYTDQEKISVAHVDASGGGAYISLGAIYNAAAPVDYLYLVEWEGAAAEMSEADIKTLLETLGWAPSWSPA